MAILRRFWRGWAVGALFGETTKGQQTLFSVIIAAAVAWPLLAFGVIAPKIAVQAIALVPLPPSVPDWIVRLVWVGLAFAIPLGVGVAVGQNAPADTPHRTRAWRWLRVWRGFPITLGLALAFGIIFVTVPIVKIVARVRRRHSAEIPLIMTASAYHDVATKIRDVLNRHGFSFRAAAPDWWVSAPIRLLSRLGGSDVRSHVPKRLEHFVTPDLAISLYPTGLVLSGRPDRLTWAHGLIAESVVRTAGLQTTDPKAQELEQRLRALWKRVEADAGARDADRPDGPLAEDLEQITRELRTLQVQWEDWQALYREILQLDRALLGQRQLLDAEPTPRPRHGSDAERATAS
ncbi:MAG TPA: hypothetical protein VHM31_06570 [Polyangia bacterium]|nr:hypothetical protein [Polyangia bacterium]